MREEIRSLTYDRRMVICGVVADERVQRSADNFLPTFRKKVRYCFCPKVNGGGGGSILYFKFSNFLPTTSLGKY